jgi:uncharacterized protein involved in cysteine biosynthesis
VEARRSGGDVGEAARAFALPAEALRLLWGEPRIRRLALVPLLLSVVALGLALAVIVVFAGDVHAWVEGLLPSLEAGSWYTWLWVGPLRVALWIGGKLLLLAWGMAVVVTSLLAASVVASPFHDALARRVELQQTGGVQEDDASGIGPVLRDGGRAVRDELLRLVFFVSVWAGLVFAGAVVPGGQLVAPLALTIFTLLFLPLDYASYTLDRRKLSFAEKRRWVQGHLPASLGFGGAAFLLCAVPILNLMAMPVLVVAGTLLALRHPPEGPASRGRGGARGTPTSP